MPSNEYYDSTGAPATGSDGTSATMRAEFDAIEEGFKLLPTLTGKASLPVFVNSGASALETKTASAALTALGGEDTTNKDASGGYVGLTDLKINFKNTAGTFTSFFTNTNTAARTYTFQDRNGTIADDTDLALKADATALHDELHTIASHSDTTATGTELETLTNGSNADSLHVHASTVPEGIVVAFVGGYFTDGSNGGFTDVIGNTAAAVNSLLNSSGYYVCDGAALNLGTSTIFNGASRYLPKLTDDRFIMGDTAAGTTGGSSAMAHTHTTPDHTLTVAEMPSHNHTGTYNRGGGTNNRIGVAGDDNTQTINVTAQGGGGAHNHGSTGAATVDENRPKFLACFYIMKVT